MVNPKVYGTWMVTATTIWQEIDNSLWRFIPMLLLKLFSVMVHEEVKWGKKPLLFIPREVTKILLRMFFMFQTFRIIFRKKLMSILMMQDFKFYTRIKKIRFANIEMRNKTFSHMFLLNKSCALKVDTSDLSHLCHLIWSSKWQESSSPQGEKYGYWTSWYSEDKPSLWRLHLWNNAQHFVSKILLAC